MLLFSESEYLRLNWVFGGEKEPKSIKQTQGHQIIEVIAYQKNEEIEGTINNHWRKLFFLVNYNQLNSLLV